MGTTDQTFKRQLHDFGQAVMQLAFGSVSDVEPLPGEVAIERHLLPDSFFRAIVRGVRCVVNIEVQYKPDETMPLRCWEYAIRAWQAYNYPSSRL